MKSFAIYLSCFIIALALSIPTVTIMKAAMNKTPIKEIVVTETTEETEYEAETEPETETETVKIRYDVMQKRFEIKALEIAEQIVIETVEYEEVEEEYLAAPESEFQPFTTYVYNGTRKKLPASENLQRIVYETAERYKLPYCVVLALLGVETGWNENADHVETHDGARYIGIGCISEKYHASDMAKRGIDIYTLDGNVEAVCWLLKAQYDRFGTIELALMAYNGGTGYAKGQAERGITENSYSQKVMKYAESFE